jgi:hypothetical protein
MVKNYTSQQLLDKVKELGSYKEIPNDYWILGVRSNEDTPNTYDDKFYLFHGQKFILVTSGTTNTGTDALLQFEKVNKKGAAIVKPNSWYYGVWVYGYHRKRVEALLQTGAKIEVYRDTNRDLKSDEIGKTEKGWFGINFHPNTYNLESEVPLKAKINWWSAGCQVVNNISKYKQIIRLTKAQKSVTYCLLTEF